VERQSTQWLASNAPPPSPLMILGKLKNMSTLIQFLIVHNNEQTFTSNHKKWLPHHNSTQ